jgi:hypothetical protein
MRRHILDELCQFRQVAVLRTKIGSVAQVGHDWGEKGWDDQEQIIPRLHGSGATLHTQDSGFFDRRLRHASYCLVFYDVPPGELAKWVLRFIRHRRFNTRAKRLGKVVKVIPSKVVFWDLRVRRLIEIDW